ncbi:hypothetical protein EAE96_000679 [Botrytis aclada]|nr:hypothetical protein EAE96_000679 [Botrytis aclada]
MTLYKPFTGTTKEELKLHRPKSPDFLLCHVCGLNSSLQEHDAYFSHVKVSMNSSRGMWSIGEKYFMKERPRHETGAPTKPNSDCAISNLLSEKSNVPVAKNMREWEDSTSFWLFMDKVPGTTLRNAQHDFTLEQHRTVGTEIAEYLAEARKFTSTKPEAPDGKPIRDQFFGADYPYVDMMTADREEWWARTEPRIPNLSKFSQKKIMQFKESYPLKEGVKYVLTHGDLDSSNIMIKDGHVTAIIDWEHGGYYPEWWEWKQWTRGKGGNRAPTLNFIRDHPDKVTWSDVLEEQMIRLGIDVDLPADWEEFDRYLYWPCTNYRRYIDEKGASAHYLAKKHKKEVKEEAKRAAIMLAFNKLSSDEQDVFLTGKVQWGSGNESPKPRDLDDDFKGLGI